jgi:hypothetical protein
MQVFVTAEGARRLPNVQLLQTGSPLAFSIVADVGPETVDALVALGLCLPPPGWQYQYR